MSKTSFVPTGFFVIRSPLLPVDEFVDLFEGPADLEVSSTPEQRRIAQHTETLRKLSLLVKRPAIREALRVGSPQLSTALARWSPEMSGESASKIASSLLRYVIRMSTRSTPFGLFAGLCTGTIGNHTALQFVSQDRYVHHLRFDGNFLCSIVEELVASLTTRWFLRYIPNPSLWEVKGRTRYARIPLSSSNTSDIFSLIDVEPTPHLRLALELARQGATPGDIVLGLVRQMPSIKQASAHSFVNQLIEHGLLVPKLLPSVTGPEPDEGFILELESSEGLSEVASTLRELQGQLREAAAARPARAIELFDASLATAKKLNLREMPAEIFQVDMVKPMTASVLNRAVLDEILRVRAVLQAACPLSRVPPELSRFIERFQTRYGEREVPLVEALDADLGIGFGDALSVDARSLLNGLPPFQPKSEEATVKLKSWELLQTKLQLALLEGAKQLEVSEAEFMREAPADASSIPESFGCIFTLLARSEEDVDKGAFKLLSPQYLSPSPASLLGRFCHADAELSRWTRLHNEAEQERAKPTVLADIVHLPYGRAANIMLRPNLRDAEIVCNGFSGAPSERQIPLRDLLISVNGDRVELRSKRTGRLIRPRNTNSFNPDVDSTGPIYRFLSTLETSEALSFYGWRWGILENSPFLPEVRSGKSILSPAQWFVSTPMAKALASKTGAERYDYLQAIRHTMRISRWVSLKKSDNVLPLDLESELCVDILARQAKTDGAFSLIDAEIQRAMGTPVRGPEGRFLHELFVPFLRASSATATSGASSEAPQGDPPLALTTDVESPARFSLPGSDVLYMKLYGSTDLADALLSDTIAPLLDDWRTQGIVQKWFFIRYRDPEPHLRLRFFGDPTALLGRVLPDLRNAIEPQIVAGAAWRLQIDTYEREIERYGGVRGILLCEDIFQNDSEACLEMLHALASGELAAEDRWKFVAAGIDGLLSAFDFSSEERLAFVKGSRTSFEREFQTGREFLISLGSKVRSLLPQVTSFLEAAGGEQPIEAESQPGLSARRARSLKPFVRRLLAAMPEGTSQQDLSRIVWNITHMSVNRGLVDSQREQEYILYAILERFYEAGSKRSKPSNRRPSSFG